MTKIDVCPLTIDELLLTDHDEAVRMFTSLNNAAEKALRLNALAKTSSALNVIDGWTDENTHDIIDITVPFMGMPEAAARATLGQADFMDQLDAFRRACPLLTQALADVEALVQQHDDGSKKEREPLTKIELHPLVMDEIQLQQPGAAMQRLGQLQSLSEVTSRLAPRLEVPRSDEVWTERDLRALMDVIVPLMGMDEAAARQVLAQATFAELAEAFSQAMPLISQAYAAIQDVVSRRDRGG